MHCYRCDLPDWVLQNAHVTLITNFAVICSVSHICELLATECELNYEQFGYLSAIGHARHDLLEIGKCCPNLVHPVAAHIRLKLEK